MKNKYPFLKKHVWLTPFFEVYRWNQAVWRKKQRKKLSIEVKMLLDKDLQLENKELFDMLGL